MKKVVVGRLSLVVKRTFVFPQPTTSYQPPTTSYQLPATNYQLPTLPMQPSPVSTTARTSAACAACLAALVLAAGLSTGSAPGSPPPGNVRPRTPRPPPRRSRPPAGHRRLGQEDPRRCWRGRGPSRLPRRRRPPSRRPWIAACSFGLPGKTTTARGARPEHRPDEINAPVPGAASGVSRGRDGDVRFRLDRDWRRQPGGAQASTAAKRG